LFLALRQKYPKLLGKVHEDRGGLEDPQGFRTASIHKRRDFGIGIDRNKAAAELLPLANAYKPGVVFRALKAKRKELLEHDGDLHTVRSSQGVELQGMPSHRKFALMGRTGDRPIDVCESTSVEFVPHPDLRRLEARTCVHAIAWGRWLAMGRLDAVLDTWRWAGGLIGGCMGSIHDRDPSEARMLSFE